jgi:hypothetical protein
MAQRSPNDGFECPKCGATSALWIPDMTPDRANVTLKCLSCASLMRLPREQVAGPASSDLDRPSRCF